MQNVGKWAGFTLAIAALAIGIVLALHMLARNYSGLESPAAMFATLIFFSLFTSIATIAYASKLDNEAEEARARRLERMAARKRRR